MESRETTKAGLERKSRENGGKSARDFLLYFTLHAMDEELPFMVLSLWMERDERKYEATTPIQFAKSLSRTPSRPLKMLSKYRWLSLARYWKSTSTWLLSKNDLGVH